VDDQNDSTGSDEGRKRRFRHFALDEDQALVVEDELADWINERFGVPLHAVPEECRHEVEDKLEALAEEVRRRGRGRGRGLRDQQHEPSELVPWLATPTVRTADEARSEGADLTVGVCQEEVAR